MAKFTANKAQSAPMAKPTMSKSQMMIGQRGLITGGFKPTSKAKTAKRG